MLEKDIVYITRPVDKKKILFYNDKTAHMPIDEEFQKLWRSVAVDGIDDNKIEEYLENQGIRSMQDTSQKVLPAKLKRKAAPKKRTYKKPRDNEHLKEILEDYEWNSKLFSTDAPNFLYHLYGKPNVPGENGDESCVVSGIQNLIFLVKYKNSWIICYLNFVSHISEQYAFKFQWLRCLSPY